MNRTFLILAGALIVGGAAVFYLYQETFIAEETGGPRVLVLVAAQDIPFGQPMQPSWLTVDELPQSYVEDRHLRASDLRRLIGVPLAQSVRAGEAILRTDLSSLSDQQRTLSAEIPQGKRAISVIASSEASFAGLLRPGDRVDILLTVGDIRVPGSGRAIVLAQNLLVLSINQGTRYEYDEQQRPTPHATSQVSLEVGLVEAQRLVLARGQGGLLHAVLRNANDVSRIAEPPELDEAQLADPVRRGDWLRRFALVERPAPPPPIVPEPPAE